MTAPSIKTRAGFTMIELIVVLIIIAAVAGVAAPTFVKAMPGFRMENDLGRLFATARYARNEAVIKGVKHRIVFNPEERIYWLELEADPFGAPGQFSPASNSWGKREALNRAVVFDRLPGNATEGTGESYPAVTFLPSGSADGEELIILIVEEDPEERAGLHIRRLTGLARVVEGEDLEMTMQDVEEAAQ